MIVFFVLAVGCSSSDDESDSDGDREAETPVDGDGEAPLDGDDDSDGDGESETEDELEPFQPLSDPENRVVYRLWKRSEEEPDPNNRLPFPYDYFTVADDATFTGLRPALKPLPNYETVYINTNLIDRGMFLLSDDYRYALNRLDGFSGFGFMMFEVTDLDESGLPQTAEASVLDESRIWLVRLHDGHPAFGERIPIWVEKRDAYELGEEDAHIHDFWYVSLRPVRPLDEQTRYAVVVRKGLKTTEGADLEPSADFLQVSGQEPIHPADPRRSRLEAEHQRLAPVLEALESDTVGLQREDLLLAFDFTTQTITHDGRTVRDWIMGGQLPASLPDFDNDDDGRPEYYDRESYAEAYRNAGVDMEAAASILHGTFNATDFRLPKIVEWDELLRRSIDHDENNDPVAQDENDVPFMLLIPKTGEQPFPVVIVQHGINSRKESEVGIANHFVREGWAVVLMDFPYHGERSEGGMAALDFVDIVYPLKARASFLQASLDQLQFIRMLRTYDLDIWPEGGDGTVDLSNEKIGYLGISLGGIVGGITAGLSPELGAAILNVGGGGLLDFVEGFLEDYGIIYLFPQHYMTQFATVAQTILEGGDSVNFARYLVDPPDDYTTKSLLMQESIDDETVPNMVTDNYARAADLPHIRPVEREVPCLTPVDAPRERFGYSQFHPAGHGELGSSSERGRRMRAQAIHFFRTYFETGEGEIIWPELDEAR